MIRRLLIATSLLTAAMGAFPASAEDLKIPSDKRMRVLEYDDNDIYTIDTKFGYQTSIVFAPDEEIQTISVGDRSPWQIIPNGPRLFIRPMLEDVTTNMTILTNHHSYQFDLKSGSTPKDPVIYVARFIYPDEKHKPSRAVDTEYSAPAPVAAPVAVPVAPKPVAAAPVAKASPMAAPVAHTGTTTPQNPNYNYTYSGPDSLAPLQVYDDGKSTYVRYSDASRALPDAFVVSGDGKESPISHSSKDGQMVIDIVAGELVLKSNGDMIHIYNETLNPR